MGAIHNELRKGGLSVALKAALGVEQTEAGLERFSETIQPTIDLWALPEWKMLRREVPFARAVTSPAVAARLSTVQVVNPAGSNVVGVVEEIWLSVAASMDIEIAIEQGDSVVGLNVTNQQGVSEDARWKVLGEASVLTYHTADVAAGIALPQLLTAATGNAGLRLSGLGFVLGPNSKLLVFAKTVNTQFRCAARWRERAAFVPELRT